MELAEARKKTWAEVATKSQRGMTLLEIMVVIAIIGLLGTAVTFGVMGFLERGKVKTAREQLKTIGNVLDMYYTDTDEYPDSLEELTRGSRPMLKKSQLKDPWGRLINYQKGGGEGQPYVLYITSPDGEKISLED